MSNMKQDDGIVESSKKINIKSCIAVVVQIAIQILLISTIILFIVLSKEHEICAAQIIQKGVTEYTISLGDKYKTLLICETSKGEVIKVNIDIENYNDTKIGDFVVLNVWRLFNRVVMSNVDFVLSEVDNRIDTHNLISEYMNFYLINKGD